MRTFDRRRRHGPPVTPIVSAAIEAYLYENLPAPDAVLLAMEREGKKRGFPIIGPLVGRLCEQLARSIGARQIFEMGSGFGYSTVWFARAVGPEGRVVHTDGSANLSEEARQWLARANMVERVRFRVGDARNLLDGGPWDIVFIDIDKEGYPDAWRLAAERVRVGGMIITDNTLWSGKVARKAVPAEAESEADGGEDDVPDAATAGVLEYNRLALSDERYLTTILPLRDGVAVSLRLS